MDGFRKKVSITALNLTNFIDVAKSAYAALQPLIRLLTKTIGDAMEWDGIEYQFGNAFGEQADEYYKKITEVTEALNINKQTFMESSAMATSMLKGFGVNSVDARKMGVGYTELAYDIWAAFNNKYKTFRTHLTLSALPSPAKLSPCVEPASPSWTASSKSPLPTMALHTALKKRQKLRNRICDT